MVASKLVVVVKERWLQCPHQLQLFRGGEGGEYWTKFKLINAFQLVVPHVYRRKFINWFLNSWHNVIHSSCYHGLKTIVCYQMFKENELLRRLNQITWAILKNRENFESKNYVTVTDPRGVAYFWPS